MTQNLSLKKLFFFFTLTVLLGTSSVSKADDPGPVKVEIKREGNNYQLFRGGQPYFIKGAGGISYTERLAQYGGNSIRTWDTRNGDKVLNDADKLGLTVTMGLSVALERHGFNYDDTLAVKQQLEKLRDQVRKYRTIPHY